MQHSVFTHNFRYSCTFLIAVLTDKLYSMPTIQKWYCSSLKVSISWNEKSLYFNRYSTINNHHTLSLTLWFWSRSPQKWFVFGLNFRSQLLFLWTLRPKPVVCNFFVLYCGGTWVVINCLDCLLIVFCVVLLLIICGCVKHSGLHVMSVWCCNDDLLLWIWHLNCQFYGWLMWCRGLWIAFLEIVEGIVRYFGWYET